jgi:GTP-binding protein HflX
LLSDTVGFIRALPPTLVKAFRATLEEVQMAEVLIHVMDASSPSVDVHRQEVEKILRELEVDKKPRIEVMNKIDLLPEGESVKGNGVIAVSAHAKTGLKALLAALDTALESDPLEDREMLVAQSEGGVLAALDAGAIILDRTFQGEDTHLHVRGPASLLGKYRKYWQN